VEAKKPLPAPPPRPEKVAVVCSHCSFNFKVERSKIGSEVECPKCGNDFEAEEPVPEAKKPKPGTQYCPSCKKLMDVRRFAPGFKAECPQCKFRFKVEKPEESEEAPPTDDDRTEFEFDVAPSKPAKKPAKAKDDDDEDDNDKKKTKSPWWPPRNWGWRQYAAIVIGLLLMRMMGCIIWPEPKDDGAKKPNVVEVKDDKAKIEAKAKADAIEAAKKLEALKLQQQLEQQKLEAEIARLKNEAAAKEKARIEAEAKAKAEAEAKAKESKSFKDFFVGELKTEYQKGKLPGTWKISNFDEATGKFTGTFSHPDPLVKGGLNGKLEGTVAKDGTVTAKMETYIGKDLDFRMEVVVKFPVEGDKIKATAQAQGVLIYTYSRLLNGKPFGVVPESGRIRHDYIVSKVLTAK